MRKILVISHSAGRTGAPLMLLAALRWLKLNTDLEFEILLKEDGDLRREFESLAPTRVWSEFAGPSRNWLIRNLVPFKSGFRREYTRLLEETYRNSGIGVIYANTITLGSILESLGGLACPVVTHVHEMSHWIDKSGPENLRQIKAHTDFYIAASPAVKRTMVSGYQIEENRIRVIPSFLTLPEQLPDRDEILALRRRLGIRAEDQVIVSSGFETWRKGKDLFVELGSQLALKRRDLGWKFLWVGGWENSGDRKRITGRINELGMGNQFIFPGEVENPLTYFALGQVFVLVSREEPLGLVGLEAALVGVPVVCFADAGGMPDFVGEDAGITVPYLDLEAMADAVEQLVSDRSLAKSLSGRAAEKVRRGHEVSIGAKAIVECLDNVHSRMGNSA